MADRAGEPLVSRWLAAGWSNGAALGPGVLGTWRVVVEKLRVDASMVPAVLPDRIDRIDRIDRVGRPWAAMSGVVVQVSVQVQVQVQWQAHVQVHVAVHVWHVAVGMGSDVSSG